MGLGAKLGAVFLKLFRRNASSAAASRETTSFLVEKTKDIVIFIRRDGTVEAVNPAFFRQLGWKESEIQNKALTSLAHDPESRLALQTISGLEIPDWEGNMDFIDPRGQPVPVHGVFRRVYNPLREAVGGVLLLYDMRYPRESLDAEKEDQLTTLSNRRWVLELLEVEYQRFSRYGGHLSVLWIRLQGLDALRRVWGHETADDVLRKTGVVLKAGLRKTDFCGRIGEREFLVVLPETTPDRALVVAAKLRHLISSVPFESGDQSLSVALGIGVASLEASDGSTEVFLERCQKTIPRPAENDPGFVIGPVGSTGT